MSAASEEGPPCSGELGEPGRAGPVMVRQWWRWEAGPVALVMAYGRRWDPPHEDPARMGLRVRPISLASFFPMIPLSPVTPRGKPSGTRQVGGPHTVPQLGHLLTSGSVVWGCVPDRPPFLRLNLMG